MISRVSSLEVASRRVRALARSLDEGITNGKSVKPLLQKACSAQLSLERLVESLEMLIDIGQFQFIIFRVGRFFPALAGALEDARNRAVDLLRLVY